MRVFAIPFFVILALTLVSCGGSGSSSSPQSGPLSGNWQITLTQEYPRPQVLLSVSGFLSQSASAVTGSLQVPQSSQNGHCAGVAALTGAVSGQTANFVIDNGGAELNLTGTVSSDQKSISGSYSGQAGGCFTTPTTGTWMASLIPPLNGNFTGTLTSSSYMALLTGQSPPAPVAVVGSFTQTGGAGSSNATLTGTIQASGYPCFRTASFSGTISGANVYLQVFGYDSTLLGTIGLPPGAPATVVVDSQGGVSLVGSGPGTSGLALGAVAAGKTFGPCPPLQTSNGSVPNDAAAISLSLTGVANYAERPPQ